MTKPVEDAVAGLADLDQISSFSSEGLSTVTVQFKDGANAGHRRPSRWRSGSTPPGPPCRDDVQAPTVLKFDFNQQPIMTLALSGERTPEQLYRLADERIRNRLETQSGVGQVYHLRGPAARGAGGGRSGPPAGLRADPAAGDPGPGGGERRPPRGPGAGAGTELQPPRRRQVPLPRGHRGHRGLHPPQRGPGAGARRGHGGGRLQGPDPPQPGQRQGRRGDHGDQAGHGQRDQHRHRGAGGGGPPPAASSPRGPSWRSSRTTRSSSATPSPGCSAP